MGTVVRTLLRHLRDMNAGIDAAAAVWHGIPYPTTTRRDAGPSRIALVGQRADPGGDVDGPALPQAGEGCCVGSVA